jgi:hypothetical protein
MKVGSIFSCYLSLSNLHAGATSLNAGLMYLNVFEDSGAVIAENVAVPAMAAVGGIFISSPSMISF